MAFVGGSVDFIGKLVWKEIFFLFLWLLNFWGFRVLEVQQLGSLIILLFKMLVSRMDLNVFFLLDLIMLHDWCLCLLELLFG